MCRYLWGQFTIHVLQQQDIKILFNRGQFTMNALFQYMDCELSPIDDLMLDRFRMLFQPKWV